MTIILRFVDCNGFIRERFVDIMSVVDTNALTLKQEICKMIDNNGILVENMRGQGYDGASNMCGSWNGLQALFLQDCPYAYYVHCFSHCLQLALNGVAKDVKVVWRFFSMLTNIVNFVSAFAKRCNELNLIRKVELKELLDSREFETGRELNQGHSLKRARATRWGSHFASITSLMSLFKETKILLQEISEHGPNQQFRGDAESNYIAMMSFEFGFASLLMDKIMGLTNFLCQGLHKKTQDIVSALNFVENTKSQFQDMRAHGWDDLFMSVVSFCEQHGIDVPDMRRFYYS
ncbi:PREDICTED: zinc finger MYM-type protein 1-like [Prunus mume]|uniref:Zinc finger MYM-type protein 1-like n=1 Tax=Prunus mume TaxID=102107 RepID=A0ABM0NBD9_PRUMU|nr:PREDICTED: zinc finger MYM-type protein 1-like [Prunus mume]